MAAQSPPLTEILTKLGDDWSIAKNRLDRYQSKGYVGDDDVKEAWEQKPEDRWEALHSHPFTSVLERVTVWTGISSDDLRKAALKHFDGYSDLVEKLLRLDDKGQTRGLWELLVKESSSVLRRTGLMPEKPTDEPPLAPHQATTNTGSAPTDKKDEGGGKKARARQPRKRTRKVDAKTAERREEREARQKIEEAIAADWNREKWVGGYQGYVDWKNQNLPEGWSKLTRHQVERAIENVNRRARYRKK